jgi:hypothetical protein
MGTLRKLMIGLVILGSLAGVAGSGTFASFNATTTNAASAFDTGTIALGQGTGVTTCWSTGVTATLPDATITNGNSAACGTLFTTKTDVKPGMTDITTDLTLTANGLTPSSFKVYMSTLCATSDDAGTVHGPSTTLPGDTGGGVDLCALLRFSIQEFNSGFTTPGTCYYGSACSAANTLTLKSFGTTYGSASAGLTLGAITPGTPRYFRVTIAFPNSATAGFENNVMGKKLNIFGLGWTTES